MNIPLFFCGFFFGYKQHFCGGFILTSAEEAFQFKVQQKKVSFIQFELIQSVFWSIAYHLLKNTNQRMSFYLCKFIQFRYLLTTKKNSCEYLKNGWNISIFQNWEKERRLLFFFSCCCCVLTSVHLRHSKQIKKYVEDAISKIPTPMSHE